MLFIYAKGKERVIFISISAYLKVQVLLLSTYNVYQEKMLTEKFLEDLKPTFFKYCHFINLLNFFSFFIFSFDIFSLPPSLSPSVFLKKFIYSFIYFWLRRNFVAVHELYPKVVASRGCSRAAVRRLLIAVVSLAEHRLEGAQASAVVVHWPSSSAALGFFAIYQISYIKWNIL